MVRLSRSLAIVASFCASGQAIHCPPQSQCAAKCGNVLTTTSPDDLVCEQTAFKSDPTGQLFTGCVDCQRSSTYYSGNESDIQTMLYNLRYTVSYCLWGNAPVKNPKVVNTPCITTKACGPFKDAVQFKNLSAEYDAYEYCSIWPTDDGPDFVGCTDCLQAEGRQYMANFIIALQAGCEQKPPAGLFIGLDGELFSSTAVQISSPSPTAIIDPAWFDHGPLNLGAKVGIAIGGFVVLLILLGCGIVRNGKRRRKAYLRKIDAKIANRGWPSPHGQAEMGQTPGHNPFRGHDDTPVSQRPLRGWDDSPMTAHSDKTFPKYFSPYSSQYNSPVNEMKPHTMPWPAEVHASGRDIGLILGAPTGSVSGSSSSDGKGKGREESYELQEVENPETSNSRGVTRMHRVAPPVLGHPGNGREVKVNTGNMV